MTPAVLVEVFVVLISPSRHILGYYPS